MNNDLQPGFGCNNLCDINKRELCFRFAKAFGIYQQSIMYKMKKIIFVLALSTGLLFSANAQTSLGALKAKATAVAAENGIDVNNLKSSIMTKLSSSLSLTQLQNPKVTALVGDFLNKKADALKVSAADKAKYGAKLTELTSSLNTGLKKVLTPAQMTKFNSLKPATNKADDVLSQLYY